MSDLTVIAQRIADIVKEHAWDWDVTQEELEAIILKELMNNAD